VTDGKSLVLALAVYALAGWLLSVVFRLLKGGRWKELVLSAATLAACLGLAEIALRRLRPYESLCRFRWLASERYHHVNPPGHRMFSGYVEGAPVVVETNEDGFRTGHSRRSFQAHAVRIAVLGDSFTFGTGVNADDAFPARLERRLRARPGTAGAAVLNAGVISYSPFLERRAFDDVVSAYRPTLVVLLLDVTDVGDDFIYARKAGSVDGRFPLEGRRSLDCHGAVHQLTRPLLAWLGAQFSYPLRLAGRRPAAPPGDYYLDPVIFQGREENRYFIYRHPLEQTAPFFRATLANVQAMAGSARRAGAGFVLVVAPRYHHWNRAECPQNWERGPYRGDEPHQYEYFRFFAEAAPAAGFPVFDLLPAFRATTEFPLVFGNDPHWNARGHEFVAARLEEYLVAGALVP
jgi:hypothetical protein